MTTISLFVPRVRCIDETTGKYREKFGNDEMYLGAVFVGVSANRAFDVRAIHCRSVGDNMDDGETSNWNRALFTADLGDEAVRPFPKAVLASLVLAEHDSGSGRNDAVDKIAKEFNTKLTSAAIDGIADAALRAAGVDAGGGTTGGTTGGGSIVRDHRGEGGGSWIPRDRGTVRDHRRSGRAVPTGDAVLVGTAGGWIAGSESAVGTITPAAPPPADGIVVAALKDWAKDQLKKVSDKVIDTAKSWAGDDVFEPVLRVLDVPSATHTWYGAPDSPEELADFVGHDGHYEVATYWQLR